MYQRRSRGAREVSEGTSPTGSGEVGDFREITESKSSPGIWRRHKTISGDKEFLRDSWNTIESPLENRYRPIWERGYLPQPASQSPSSLSPVLSLPRIDPSCTLIPGHFWHHRMLCQFYRLLFLRRLERILGRDVRRFRLCGGLRLWSRLRCRGSSRLKD